MLRHLLVLVPLLNAAAAAPVLELRTVQQAGATVKYDPDDGARPGLCMEILRAVVRIDPDLRFSGLAQSVPLRRVERLLGEAQIDAFFCLLRTAERERRWRYLPVPLYTVRHVVVQRTDDPRSFVTLADLAAASRSKPVLVARGSVLGQRLVAASVTTAEVGSEREALQMLALGRADLVYGQDLNLHRHIADARLADRVRTGSTVFLEEPQYATVRADLPVALEERLVRALRQLERDGTLRQLAEKYR